MKLHWLEGVKLSKVWTSYHIIFRTRIGGGRGTQDKQMPRKLLHLVNLCNWWEKYPTCSYAHTTFIHHKPIVKRQWINYNVYAKKFIDMYTVNQWRIQKFWKGGGGDRRQFISPVHRKCTQRSIGLLHGKRRLLEKMWANKGAATPPPALLECATAVNDTRAPAECRWKD